MRFLILATICVIGFLAFASIPVAYWFVWGPVAGILAAAVLFWIVFSNATSDAAWRRAQTNTPSPKPTTPPSRRLWPGMTYACPHCGVAFGWRREPVLRRRTSDGLYRLQCPRCETGLMLNRHPAEKLGDVSLVALIGIIAGLVYFEAPPFMLMVAIGVALIGCVAVHILVIVRTNNCPRYAALPDERMSRSAHNEALAREAQAHTEELFREMNAVTDEITRKGQDATLEDMMHAEAAMARLEVKLKESQKPRGTAT